MKEYTNNIPKEKRITYAIHVNAKTPYELYLDDILINFFYENNMNRTIELNPYLLDNGIHKLKIRYLPRTNTADGLLDPKNIVFNKDSKWNVFFVKLNKEPDADLGYTNEIDYKGSELTIVAPPAPVPYWEQEWDLEIKHLPYKLKGWSQSQDLSNVDSDVLEKEVLAYYENYRILLNEGKTDENLAAGLKKDEEIIVATYGEDIEWYTSPEERKEELLLAKENMLPIENYKLVLYAEGRIVSLLVNTGKYRNWPILMSRNEKGRTTGWGLKLHKPRGSDTFEIIRK